MKIILKNILKVIGAFVFLLALGYVIFVLPLKPSNNRNWVADNAVLPYAEINGNLVKINNVRNNTYRNPNDFDVRHYDETYDLSKLNQVDFIVAPFNPPTAHTFVSFGFEDGKHVAISIEARREKDESYNVLKGMFRNFELMYVIADEADVVKLRTNYRSDGEVYMYPIKVSNTKAKELFLDMIKKANDLYENPQFYNTITKNCTGLLVNHVNRIATKDAKIGFSYKYVLPAYSGKLAYEHGLINDEGSFEALEEKYRITDIAKECEEVIDFSLCVRDGIDDRL